MPRVCGRGLGTDSAFDNVVVQTLLTYKWRAFGQSDFKKELARYVLHLVLVTCHAFATAVFTRAQEEWVPDCDAWGFPPLAVGSSPHDGPSCTNATSRQESSSWVVQWERPPPMPLATLVWTGEGPPARRAVLLSLWCVTNVWLAGQFYSTLRRVCACRGAHLQHAATGRSAFDLVDYVHMTCQLLANWWPEWFDPHFGARDHAVTGRVVLQSLAVLTLWWKGLYYFRGSLQLGALVHSVGAICVALAPIILTSLMLLVSFSVAIMLLLLHAEGMTFAEAVGASITSFNRALRLPALYEYTPWRPWTHEAHEAADPPTIVIFE